MPRSGWLGEILIVFVGVYAAFLLNAWQTQRQDRGNPLLFYDPQTRQLKPLFAWCLTAQQKTDRFLRDSLAANEALLAPVRAERASLR